MIETFETWKCCCHVFTESYGSWHDASNKMRGCNGASNRWVAEFIVHMAMLTPWWTDCCYRPPSFLVALKIRCLLAHMALWKQFDTAFCLARICMCIYIYTYIYIYIYTLISSNFLMSSNDIPFLVFKSHPLSLMPPISGHPSFPGPPNRFSTSATTCSGCSASVLTRYIEDTPKLHRENDYS